GGGGRFGGAGGLGGGGGGAGPALRGIRNPAGAGDRAFSRQEGRRSRSRRAWPARLADAGMGPLGPELPCVSRTRTRFARARADRPAVLNRPSQGGTLFWSSVAASGVAIVDRQRV